MMPWKMHRPEQGFTLMEILIACAIAAIAMSIAVIKLDPSDNQRLKLAAETLINRLEAAHNEAVTRGQAVSFSTDGQGYQFWIEDTERNIWVALPNTNTIASAQLPQGIVLSTLRINGMPRPLGERLTFSSSGLADVFTLTLSAGSLTFDISGDALGRIEIRHAL